MKYHLWLYLLLISLAIPPASFHFFMQKDESCRGARPGDCDPQACGGSCEARYVRFYDALIKGDRTVKSCQCQREKICQIIGMHAYAGCRSYATLSPSGQRLIRIWSMTREERRSSFSEKKKHQQLIYGHSRFCCRTTTGKINTQDVEFMFDDYESASITYVGPDRRMSYALPYRSLSAAASSIGTPLISILFYFFYQCFLTPASVHR